jgi:N-acetylneuraminic acid mutarotase
VSGWTSRQDPSVQYTGSGSPGAVSVNGKIYSIGSIYLSSGSDTEIVLETVSVYDTSTNSWAIKTSGPSPRYGPSCAVINGKIYVVGGYYIRYIASPYSYDYYYAKNCDVYDPSTDSWTSLASLPTNQVFFSAAAANGKLYAIGGYDTASYAPLSTVESYDPSSNSWSAVQSLPSARELAGCATIFNKIYAIGGYSSTSNTNSNFCYDPSADSWSQKANQPVASVGPAVTLNNLIYRIGGSTGNPNNYYDPSTDTWHPCASDPLYSGLNVTGAVATSSNIYEFGYYSTSLANVYIFDEYTPAAEVDLSYFRKN